MNQPPIKHLAGVKMRLVAAILDAIILQIVFFLIGIIFGIGSLPLLFTSMLRGNTDVAAAGVAASLGATVSVLFFVSAFISWIYYAVFESSILQATPGKWLLGMKVTSLEDKRIGFTRASARYFWKYASTLPLYAGFFMAIYHRRNQALHDLLAKCLVWQFEVVKKPDTPVAASE